MLIGLTGKAGSGKDTACQLIRGYFAGERSFERRAFADKLKISAARNFYPTCTQEDGLDFCNWLKENEEHRIQVVDNGEIVSDISGRQFLQRYGTEAHREVFGQEFWLDAILPSKNSSYGLYNDVIVTDVRFPNEADRVHECGGVVWEIIRRDEDTDSHASEASLPRHMVDKVFKNNRTKEELREKLIKAVNEL